MHLGFDPTVSKDACSGTVQQGELCFSRPLALFKAQWVNFGDAVRSYVPVAARSKWRAAKHARRFPFFRLFRKASHRIPAHPFRFGEGDN